MKKRMLSVLLVLVMVLGMLPVEARAAGKDQIIHEESDKCGATDADDVSWFYRQLLPAGSETTKQILVISGTGAMEDYKSTGNYLWSGISKSIHSIVIEPGVTHIGANAFTDFKSATEVSIPASVKTIGSNAFSGCTSLSAITYAGTKEQWKALSANAGISASQDIVTYAVTASGTCGDNLTWKLEGGVLTISGTGKMADYTLKPGAPWYDYRRNIKTAEIKDGVTSVGKYAFSHCGDLTSVTIPDSVTSIGSFAFYDCTSLTSITIPDSVTRIDEGAFSSCNKLTEISIGENNKNYSFKDGILYNKDITNLVCCPGGLTDVTIPSTVTSIGNDAFYRCKELTSVTIPDRVTSIGSSAFSGCSGLTSVMIPNRVTSIGHFAFYDCSGLTSITIPDGVTIIGNETFHRCSKLTSIKIPASVTSIKSNAFTRCENLADVYYGGSKAQWDSIEVSTEYGGNDSLTNATIHYGAWTVTVKVPDNAVGGVDLKVKIESKVPFNETVKDAEYFEIPSGLGKNVSIAWSPTEPCIVELDFTGDIENTGTVAAMFPASVFSPVEGGVSLEKNTFEWSVNFDPKEESITLLLFSVKAEWVGDENALDQRPAGLDVNICRDGEVQETLTLNAGNSWTKTWETTITSESSEDVGTWTVQAASAPKNYDVTVSSSEEGGYVFTCTLKPTTEPTPDPEPDPEPPTPPVALITKVNWMGDEAAQRPGSFTVQLCRDGKDHGDPVQLTAANKWTHSWENLEGDHTWTVRAVSKPTGYKVTVNDSFTFTCTYEAPEETKPDPTPDPIYSGDCGAQGNNVTWTLSEDGVLTITGSGDMKDYTAEDKTNDSSTLPPWYGHRSEIKEIKIGSGVTHIGDFAFVYCKNVKEVTFPDSVEEIGRQALYGCTGLEKVTLPEGVKTIHAGAFLKCDSLKEVDYGGSEADWKNVSVGKSNDPLNNAHRNYGKTTPAAPDGEKDPDDGKGPEDPVPPTDEIKPGGNEGPGEEEKPSTPTYPSYPSYPSGSGSSSKPSTPSTSGTDKKDDPAKEQEKPAAKPVDVKQLIEGIVSPIQKIVKAVTSNGTESAYVDWVERIEPPQFALDLYDVLVAGADANLGANSKFIDCLIDDDCFTVDPDAKPASSVPYNVVEIEEADFSLAELYSESYGAGSGALGSSLFTDDAFNTVNTAASDRTINYPSLQLGDLVQTSAYNGIFVTKIAKGADYDAAKKETCRYVSTVFQAFDRDHPEIFWLTGACKVRIAVLKSSSGAQEAYFFLVLADKNGFTMRAPAWTAPGAVTQGIARRDAAVNSILAQVTGATEYERIRQLNRILTESNEYNTSYDLNAIGNEPHECLRALEGGAGTNGPVCDGYSRAFKVLCDRLGIPCVLENGYARTSPADGGSFHMWNSVQVNGGWYGVDITWDDPVVAGVSGARSGRENEKYLLVGSNTDIGGLTFAVSHPAVNQAALGGVAFNNGPVLSAVAFSAVTAYAPAVQSELPFTDVPVSSPYYEAVKYVYGKKLLIGDSSATFSPGATMSRAMMVTMFHRLEGTPAVSAAAGFADVQPGQWYTDAVAWAAANRIVLGYDARTFGTNDDVTREQIVTLLYRRAVEQGLDVSASGTLRAYADAGTVSEYAADAVRWAVGAGVLPVSGGRLNPDAPASRGEVALILMNYQLKTAKYYF